MKWLVGLQILLWLCIYKFSVGVFSIIKILRNQQNVIMKKMMLRKSKKGRKGMREGEKGVERKEKKEERKERREGGRKKCCYII